MLKLIVYDTFKTFSRSIMGKLVRKKEINKSINFPSMGNKEKSHHQNKL